jgi:hypothetical protein
VRDWEQAVRNEARDWEPVARNVARDHELTVQGPARERKPASWLRCRRGAGRAL